MKHFLLTAFFYFSITTIIAQNGISMSAGAKGAAMANASVTFQDVFALTSNQAGIAFIDKTSVGLLAEQRFLNNDIRQIGAVAAMPSRFGSFGILVQSFGFDAYNEQKIGLAYARKLAKDFAIGVQFDYLNTRIPEYGNQGTLTFEAGLQAQVVENLWLGASIFNPIRTQDSIGVLVSSQVNLGLSYQFSEKIMLAAEVEKDFEYNPSVKVGLDYRIIDQLSLRLGIGTQPTQNSFGIGVHLKQFQLDFAASYHQILGFTPAFSMSLMIGD